MEDININDERVNIMLKKETKELLERAVAQNLSDIEIIERVLVTTDTKKNIWQLLKEVETYIYG